MKREMDLCRRILLEIEKSNESPLGWTEISLEDYSEEQVSYHIQLLDEAGLIEGEDVSTMAAHCWKAKRLTFVGHDYIDTIRDEGVWVQSKQVATKAGGWTLEILVGIAKELITRNSLQVLEKLAG